MAYALFKHVFKVKEGEQLDLKIKLPEDNRGVVHGVVFDCRERAVKDAVVKLFKLKHDDCKCEFCPVTHTFTDEQGQFLFGPLCPEEEYAIKIWVDGVCVKCEKVECDVCLKCINCKCDKHCEVPCICPGKDECDEEEDCETQVVPHHHHNHGRRGY